MGNGKRKRRPPTKVVYITPAPAPDKPEEQVESTEARELVSYALIVVVCLGVLAAAAGWANHG